MAMRAVQRAELLNAVRRVMLRANGQRGTARFDIQLDTVEGEPGNAATLIEALWEVRGGRLHLRMMIDGVMWGEISA